MLALSWPFVNQWTFCHFWFGYILLHLLYALQLRRISRLGLKIRLVAVGLQLLNVHATLHLGFHYSLHYTYLIFYGLILIKIFRSIKLSNILLFFILRKPLITSFYKSFYHLGHFVFCGVFLYCFIFCWFDHWSLWTIKVLQKIEKTDTSTEFCIYFWASFEFSQKQY